MFMGSFGLSTLLLSVLVALESMFKFRSKSRFVMEVLMVDSLNSLSDSFLISSAKLTRSATSAPLKTPKLSEARR